MEICVRARVLPVVDLFAGPGGLGEGFSAFSSRGIRFEIGLSIEKDESAHKTLTLRTLYRELRRRGELSPYYSYVRGEGPSDLHELLQTAGDAGDVAALEAERLTLGSTDDSEMDGLVRGVAQAADDWVLIGGPPCQAYSLVGRARRSREDREQFEQDESGISSIGTI